MTAPANQIKPGNPSIFYLIALLHNCIFWMQTEMVVDVASILKKLIKHAENEDGHY